jgi:hypothetical protein
MTSLSCRPPKCQNNILSLDLTIAALMRADLHGFYILTLDVVHCPARAIQFHRIRSQSQKQQSRHDILYSGEKKAG